MLVQMFLPGSIKVVRSADDRKTGDVITYHTGYHTGGTE